MDESSHRQACQEVLDLYLEACRYHLDNPDDTEGVTQRVDATMGRSMDLFLWDVESVTPDTTRIMFRRTVLTPERIAELAAEGMMPYQRPITLEELLAETPGMVPLLLARAVFCWKFHYMPVRTRLMQHWRRFVENYAERLPAYGS